MPFKLIQRFDFPQVSTFIHSCNIEKMPYQTKRNHHVSQAYNTRQEIVDKYNENNTIWPNQPSKKFQRTWRGETDTKEKWNTLHASHFGYSISKPRIQIDNYKIKLFDHQKFYCGSKHWHSPQELSSAAARTCTSLAAQMLCDIWHVTWILSFRNGHTVGPLKPITYSVSESSEQCKYRYQLLPCDTSFSYYNLEEHGGAHCIFE